MKILYIYAGERKDKFEGQIGVDFADTSFYGLNHLRVFGIDASYKEWWGSPFLKKVGDLLGFNLKQAILFFRTFGYDVVFGSSVLNMVLFKKIIPRRTKFVLNNISLTRLWQNNKDKPAKSKFIEWLLRGVDGVVCLSKKQESFCLEEFPFLAGKVFFVPFGVDASFLRFEREGRQDFILSVGRDNGRDYKTVIEVAKMMPEEKFEIVASPRNLVGLKDIPPNVIVSLDIDKRDLEEKYRKAKIVLLLTHKDNYKDGADCSGQTVLLEAMASGLPVVASARACLKDYVKDSKDAFLVDFYDADGVVARIKELQKKEVREKIARNARETIEKSFTSLAFASGLSKVFKRVCYGRRL